MLVRRCGTLAAVLAFAIAGTAGAETRTPSAWPLTATSPWNSAIGTGAQFGSPACDLQLHLENTDNLRPWINAEQYSFPIYQASSTDPLVPVYKTADPASGTDTSNPQGSYNIPDAATQAAGTDRSLEVIEPSGTVTDEFWLFYRQPTGIFAGHFTRPDLVNGDGFGTGIRAARASALGGLLRTWELQAGNIRHALAVSLTQARMTASFVPPAQNIDGNHSGYHGTIPMGQLFAIPSTTSIASLGLTSAAGQAIATAAQKYGVYVVDTGGAFAFYAEPGAASLVNPARATQGGKNSPPWNNSSDVARIIDAMKCVSNNAGPTWGGGGTPLAPPPPPFG
jgi:hypothetical protein